MTEDAIGKQIADIAVEIHQEVGPGLLKTVYEVDRRPGYLLNFSEVPMKPGSPASLSGWKRIVDSLAFLASWRLGERELLLPAPTNSADEPSGFSPIHLKP